MAVVDLSGEPVVAALLSQLRSARVTYFPIRHHSPACAAHIRRWVGEHRPASILVEGPASFTDWIPHLVDPRCVCPIALYTRFADTRRRTQPGTSADPEASPFGPPRFAAYYPFCDYSPELVALRAGQAVGARLRFIDLEYAEMVLARSAGEPGAARDEVRVDSLAADAHLWHSAYVRALAARLGCRDFNEAWDHLFESDGASADTAAFCDRLAAYCALSRVGYSAADLRGDGTLAREACMAAAIRDELRRNEVEGRSGPVLVVTGGFHTAALPGLVAAGAERPAPTAFGADEVGTWLMRYSFDQLDALAGYASGMPSPAYYDRLWHAATEGPVDGAHLAADLIVDISRLVRTRNLPALLSTPDAIAAVQMARQLAALRGHPWPLREDILDGIRSCFIKGEMAVEGRLLMGLVHGVLAGDRVGVVPPDTPLPPIVADFLAEARKLRLPVDSVERSERALDLYRNANHRRMSRLFHRLNLLNVPFAVFRGGPDFVHGSSLELLQEHWLLGWSPSTESALIQASVYGPTVEEAAAARLCQEIARLEEEGSGRSTAAAVALLVRACRLGLQRQTARLVTLVDAYCDADPSLPSVVGGLSQLGMLAHSREPLEAADLSAVPRLAVAAYRRACRLLHGVAGCPDDAVDATVQALQVVREVLAASTETEDATRLDPDLFHAGLRAVVDHPPATAQAAVVGAGLGVLYGAGLIDEAELLRTTCGYLGGTATETRRTTGVLRGLLATAREAAWQVAGLVRAIDEQFQAWDEATFLAALPDLRLAFTGLTPREIVRVADHVSQVHGGAELGELVHADLDELEVRHALAVTRRVRATLKEDGLTGGDDS